MEIAKNLFVIVVLGAVCYGVYVSLSTDPHAPVPPGEDEPWTTADAGAGLSAPPGEEVTSAAAMDPFRRQDQPATYSTAAAGEQATDHGSAREEKQPASELSPVEVRPVPAPSSARQDAPVDGDPTIDPFGQPYPDTSRGGMDLVGTGSPESGELESAAGSGDRSADDSASPMWNEVLRTAEPALSSNNLVEALAALSQWYGDSRLTAGDQQRLLRLLDQLACTAIYYRDHHVEPPYVVQPNETLEDIARRYQVPWQLLANINGILDPRDLRPGETLKVLRGPFSAVVELGQQQLTLMLGKLYAGRFKIHTNANDMIVEGRYQVRAKLDAPPRTIVPPTPLASSAPPQPAGWVGLTGTLGLHGGYSEQGGPPPLPGCIQLSDQDLADVRAILSENSTVVIRR